MLLSVVVTIVDGGSALRRCLEALVAQDGAPSLEVLVPYDDTVPDVDELAKRFPSCRFLRLGTVRTSARPDGALGQHELYDRRRAAGLTASTGDLVAILEDRGVPRRDWARSATALHAERADAVIGGAVENGCNRVLNWSVYFCDFGRYQRPFAPHQSRRIADINVCYKGASIRAVKGVWSDRYLETLVHDALDAQRETMWLSPDLIVDQVRGDLRLGALCRERLGWGRLHAMVRLADVGLLERLLRAAAFPLVVPLLLTRILRDRAVRGRSWIACLLSLPSTVLLLTAWSAGEAVGYLLGRPIEAAGRPRS